MNRFAILPICFSVSLANAELIGLDERSLEDISGQTGIGINIDKLIDIGSITYSDADATSGGQLQFENIQIGSPNDVLNTQAHSQHIIDVDETDGLFIDSLFAATRIQVGSVSVGDHIGLRSFGGMILDFEGTNLLNINGDGGTGFLISSESHFTNVNFIWTTNGSSVRFDNMTINSQLTDAVFEEKNIAAGETALVIDIPFYYSDVALAGICFSADTCTSNNSIGAFSATHTLTNSQIQIRGGGREGKGITMNMQFEFDDIVNLSGDGNVFTYTDEANVKFAKQSGAVAITGFTFDIGKGDAVLGDYIAMQWGSILGNFKSSQVEIAGNSVGAFDIQFEFSDATHDSVDYKNQLKLAPGVTFSGFDFASDADLVAAGFDGFMTNFYSKVNENSDGISTYNQWNMTADFYYTDDTHTVMADNLYAYGEGYTTMDIRSGVDSIDPSNDVSENFLALGIRNYKVNYGLDGLRIGDDTSQLQNGYEFLGFFADARFTLNGAIEIRGGGANGQGLTLDTDMLISDGNFTLTKSGAAGIHLDAVTYEFHIRDMTMDVDNDGIKLVIGELWSDFIADDVRFGDRTTGSSLGSVAMQQYQQGSEIVISGGGAGIAQCMGGTGADEASCHADGGSWLDTGIEGLTVKHKQILLQEDVAQSKANSISVEMNRSAGVPGTGQAMKLNNIYTSDGYDDGTNTYGIEQTFSVDVARTRVIKKESGADNNGISGNEGDELITTGSGASDYIYVASPDASQRANRPEALIISNNIKIKELNIDNVQMIHGSSSSSANMLQGVKLQNLDLTSRLSVTPIR